MAEYPKNKKYIKWVNYGCEGWQPYGYDNLEEAISDNSHMGSSYVIDKAIVLVVQEKEVE